MKLIVFETDIETEEALVFLLLKEQDGKENTEESNLNMFENWIFVLKV